MDLHLPTSSNRSVIYARKYALALTLLVGFFALRWWRNEAASKRVEIATPGSKTVMDVAELALVHPLDIDRQQIVRFTSSGDRPKRLLVFLTAADCYSCLEQIGDWIGLANSYPRDKFEVDMLFVYTAPNEAKAFHNSYNLPYRFLLDQNNEIANSINVPPKTPVSVLVDGNFHVLAAQGAENDNATRQAFVAKLGTLIKE
jgi:peroxiredoxin